MNNYIHQSIAILDISAVAGDDGPIDYAVFLRKSFEGSKITATHQEYREIVDLGTQVTSRRKKVRVALSFEEPRDVTDHKAAFQAELGSKRSQGARIWH